MKFVTNINRVFLAALSIVMLLGTGSMRPAMANSTPISIAPICDFTHDLATVNNYRDHHAEAGGGANEPGKAVDFGVAGVSGAPWTKHYPDGNQYLMCANTNVKAAFNGTITRASDGCGAIMAKLTNTSMDIEMWYMHLDISANIPNGAQVNVGDVIGTAGRNGCTGKTATYPGYLHNHIVLSRPSSGAFLSYNNHSYPDNSADWVFGPLFADEFADGGAWAPGTQGTTLGAYGKDVDETYSADFTGDGRDDMLIVTDRVNADGIAGNNDLAYFMMGSNENNFVDRGLWRSSYGLKGDKVVVGDFTGDKKADILLGTTRLNDDGSTLTLDYSWFLMESNGTSFIDRGKVLSTFGYGFDYYYQKNDLFLAGDMNGDGKADLVRGSADNLDNKTMSWTWSRSNGSGAMTKDMPQIKGAFGEISDKFFLADANADGLADLYVASTRYNGAGSENTNDYTHHVAINTAARFDDGRIVTPSYGLVGDVIMVTDFTGDGRADILAGAPRVIPGVQKVANTLTWYVATLNDSASGVTGYTKLMDSYGFATDRIHAGNFKKDNMSVNSTDLTFARKNTSTGNLEGWWVLYSKV